MSENATSQSAQGSARGEFDQVSFQVNIEGRGNTGPQAKQRAQEHVKELRNVIAQLKEKGIAFEDEDNTSSFTVSQEQRYDQSAGRHIPAGYLATFSTHLVTKMVDRAADITDALTSNDGLNVQSPNFSVCSKRRQELQKQAVTNAWKLAQDRFQQECTVLGLNPQDFEVATWSVRYSEGESMRPQMYAAASMEMANDADGGGGSGPLVQSGAATVNVTLNVGFRRK